MNDRTVRARPPRPSTTLEPSQVATLPSSLTVRAPVLPGSYATPLRSGRPATAVAVITSWSCGGGRIVASFCRPGDTHTLQPGDMAEGAVA